MSDVWTKADWRLYGDIWIAILALRRRASGQDTTSFGRLIDLPFIGTWKESETVWVLIGVRTGCCDVRTDASWNRSFSIQCRVWTEKIGCPDGWCWSVWRPVGMNTSPGRLTGNLKSSIFFAVQSLLKMLWQVKSLFTASLHISDFVQTQNEAKILTNSPFGHFGTKITWPVWKYNPGPKIKNYSSFCHKRTKGKTE